MLTAEERVALEKVARRPLVQGARSYVKPRDTWAFSDELLQRLMNERLVTIQMGPMGVGPKWVAITTAGRSALLPAASK